MSSLSKHAGAKTCSPPSQRQSLTPIHPTIGRNDPKTCATPTLEPLATTQSPGPHLGAVPCPVPQLMTPIAFVLRLRPLERWADCLLGLVSLDLGDPRLLLQLLNLPLGLPLGHCLLDGLVVCRPQAVQRFTLGPRWLPARLTPQGLRDKSPPTRLLEPENTFAAATPEAETPALRPRTIAFAQCSQP